MLANQVRQYIIKPTLIAANLWSEAAEVLVYGTGWVETGYSAIIQIGSPKNGGLGFWQDEPSDYKDLCFWLKNKFNESMLDNILNASCHTALPPDPTILISDLRLGALFCRVHYHRIKQPIPDANDAKGMAEYHLKYYNSGGKADVDRNIGIFERIIKNEI